MKEERPSGYNRDKPTEYVQDDGSTEAMQSVIAKRAAFVALKGRKRMDAAFRMRAGMIGVLQSCLCDYPLSKYETASGHHEGCLGGRMFDSIARVHGGR